MKTVIAAAFLLGVSSVTAAHAEWEILDPGTAVNTAIRSETKATPTAAANAAVSAEQAQVATKTK